jgi:hypothetical protein
MTISFSLLAQQFNVENTLDPKAKKLVANLLQTEINRDANEQIKLFAPSVISGGKATPKDKLKVEMLAYYKRWPVAQLSLLEPPQITQQKSANCFEITYKANYRVESPERRKWSQGTLVSKLTVILSNGQLLINAVDDKTSATSKGELNPNNGESKTGSVDLNGNTDPSVLNSSTKQIELSVQEGIQDIWMSMTNVASQLYAVSDGSKTILIDLKSGLEIARKEGISDSQISGIGFDKSGRYLFKAHCGRSGFQCYSIWDTKLLEDRVVSLPIENNANHGCALIMGEADADDIDSLPPIYIKKGSVKEEIKFAVPKQKAEMLKKNIIKNNEIKFIDKKLMYELEEKAKNFQITSTPTADTALYSFKDKIYSMNLETLESNIIERGDKFQVASSALRIAVNENDSKIKITDLIGSNKTSVFAGKSPIAWTPNAPKLFYKISDDRIGFFDFDQNIQNDFKTPYAYDDFSIPESGDSILVRSFKKLGIFNLKSRSLLKVFESDSNVLDFLISNDASILAVACDRGPGEVGITVSQRPFNKSDIRVIGRSGFRSIAMHFDSRNKGLWVAREAADKLVDSSFSYGGILFMPFMLSRGALFDDAGLSEAEKKFAASPSCYNLIPSKYKADSLVCVDSPSQSFSVRNISDGLLKFRYFPLKDGGVLVVTPDHYYLLKSKRRETPVAFRLNTRAYPFEQFDLRLNRPDIVLERLGAPDEAIAIAKQLREKRLKRMGVTEDMIQPDFHLPEIEIVGDLPSSTAESELVLKIKASDSKYPLDRLRLYVNNVPVNGKEGELLRDANSQTLERTIPIKLASGRNKIQVSVLNSAGAESLYANAEITCAAQHPKPTLYAIAMGVSEYANPDWNLKYAAKDAKDVAERIRVRSGASYGDLKELLLTDREVTKESLTKIREFLSKATVDDTVLMFVAGHGLLDEKYDYYFGTSDIDFSNPSGKGIAFEEFDDLLAELPCLKKSLLIDTCHAGELDEDEKKALAAAQTAPASTGSSQQVAMHQVGTRGMTIKPIEGARGKSEWYDRLQGLFVDLRRGSGSTILSSSAGAEYALESSEQKNGLFTYAVLEALDGKQGSDANKDGSVTMSELADYVKTRVAALTNNKQTPNVRRVNLEADFALSKK